MELRVAHSLEDVDAADWNALAGTDNPFLRHEFLVALERHGCVGAERGWLPWHLLLIDDQGLAAAAPAYLKGHSWGEFVFDFSWAEAHARLGLSYYPKLVAAVPFSPVNGPRLLLRPGAPPDAAVALSSGAIALAANQDISSAHWLFPPREQCELLAETGYFTRTGYQFHWHNDGFGDFDGFLARFSSKKRKNVRQERARVRELGISFRWLRGEAITPVHWQAFHAYYRRTFRDYGNIPPLTLPFFHEIGRTLGERVLLISAERGREMVAAALCLVGPDTLYGRYWGGASSPGLHFEACYYQGIEFCLKEGLTVFEPGAQGEHKIARGFLPTPTYSAHWIADTRMRAAIQDAVAQEAVMIDARIEALRRHSPFRADEG